MSYGVLSTGFSKKTLTIIREEIKAELRDTISSELDLLDTSVLGQIEGIFSDKIREMWDVAEAVYRAFYPDSASGEALDQVSSITGVVRLPQSKSTVTLRLWLNNGVTVTLGSIVSVGPTGSRFVTIAAVTNSTGAKATVTVEAESEDYGPVVGYAESIDTIQTPIAGWSAAAAVSGTETENFTLDGLTLQLEVDEDGSTQTVNFAAGDPWSAADVAIAIEAQTTGIDAYDDGLGRIRIASDTNGPGSSIEIIGGTSLTELGLTAGKIKGMNALDADIGRNIETDPGLRLRRDSALRSSGSATVEAIYSALVLTDDVVQVVVLENVTSVVDANGLPGKSFECVVFGGTDIDIAETIWREKPAGILAFGLESETVTDSQGYDHEIGFSRPTEIPLHLEYTLTTDPDLYPADGDDQVKAAAVAYAATLEIGQDVIALEFRSVALDIAGVIDVPTFKIDTVDPPTGTSNIPMTFRQLATVDTVNVDVV